MTFSLPAGERGGRDLSWKTHKDKNGKKNPEAKKQGKGI